MDKFTDKQKNNFIIGLVAIIVAIIVICSLWYYFYPKKVTVVQTEKFAPEMEMRPMRGGGPVEVAPRQGPNQVAPLRVAPLPAPMSPMHDDRDYEPVGMPDTMFDNAYILEGSDLCMNQ